MCRACVPVDDRAVRPTADPVTRFAVTLLAAGHRVLADRFAASGRPGARLMLNDIPHLRGPAAGALTLDRGLA
jgi:hypothetical protein